MRKKDKLGAAISEHSTSAIACDVCGREFKTGESVYDCPSVYGPWGFFCVGCVKEHGKPTMGTVHTKLMKHD